MSPCTSRRILPQISGVQSTLPSNVPELRGPELPEKPLLPDPLEPLPEPEPSRVALPVSPTVGHSPPCASATICCACS